MKIARRILINNLRAFCSIPAAPLQKLSEQSPERQSQQLGILGSNGEFAEHGKQKKQVRYAVHEPCIYGRR